MDPTRVKLLDTIGMIWDPQGKAQTSFYEQALFFYLSKVFPDAVSRDRSTGIEFDVYIPSAKTAIEYDGQLGFLPQPVFKYIQHIEHKRRQIKK